MSAERQSIILTYTPLESGDAESRWIRVEQEEPEGESLSVAEAAELIDSLYGIEPCDDGMGGGGEEMDEENEPDEEQVEQALAGMIDRAGLCREPEYWEAVIRVYRSHKQPGYELRSETADVENAVYETVRASHRQDVEASGAVIELDMPYDGGLTGIPAGVVWTARGSTINLDRPVNARLVLRYDTAYDRVTLRVPTEPGTDGERATLPAASVVAFWGDLAASCDLTPSPQDEADAGEIAAICAKGPGGSSGGVKPKDCWQRVTHYDRCNCSRKRTGEWTETVPAPCDEPKNVEVFGGYVNCEGEEDDLSDPEYYMRHCCEWAPVYLLPRCRKSYMRYDGGHEIESGPDHWKNIYGTDVAMVAVLPAKGYCGDLITEWRVPPGNCCDEAEPLAPWEGNPTTIEYRSAVALRVTGGISPQLVQGRPRFRWRASAGYTFDNGSGYKEGDAVVESVSAGENACDNGVVEVTDGCSTTRMPLTMVGGPGGDMYLSPEEATVSPGSILLVEAYNYRGKVMWNGGALRMLGEQGQGAMYFEAPDEFCGTTTVTATDACMSVATAIVISTAGKWIEVGEFDKCSPPPWGVTPCGGNNVGYGHTTLTYSAKGYRAEMRQTAGYVIRTGEGHGWQCNNFEGDCDEGVAAAPYQNGWESPCGYTGREMFYNPDCRHIPIQPSPNWNVDIISPLCHRQMSCNYIAYPDVYSYSKTVYAASQWVEKLWRWECE